MLLTGLAPETVQQTSLFATQCYDPRKQARMRAVDRIATNWGRSALRYAREGLVQDWRMRQGLRSPRYTTRWDELLVVQT